MTKICNGCKSHSEEWSLSKELAKRNRKLKIALLVVVVLWLVTVIGWMVTLSAVYNTLPDTVSESLFLGESDGQTIYETEVS